MAHCQNKCLQSCEYNEFPKLNKLKMKLSISSLVSMKKIEIFKSLLSCNFQIKNSDLPAVQATPLLPRQKHKNISHITQEIA
jgi:hypothetical protein